ncbi:MAG: hypothetical protein M1820_002829 [Bogoriella megaspora]|nr:MAG: hypothetical protein M1820_002829 [Bogoriella megaspora]
MRWQNGLKLVECPLKEPAHKEYYSPYWHIHRADLHRGLLQYATDLGIKVHLDSKVVDVEPNIPSLTTQAGGVFFADLIVASDGTIDARLPEGVNQKAGSNDEAREAFRGWDQRIDIMLQHATSILEWRLFTHKAVPRWVHRNSKVLLIGDAAHAMTPYLAQGAAMGIKDAAILGGLLTAFPSPSSLEVALPLYEQLRHSRTAKVAAASIDSRWFTQMEDGPEQRERDEWLQEHPGIHEGHRNIRSDRTFLDWLFGYDAYKVLDKALSEHKQRETKEDVEAGNS